MKCISKRDSYFVPFRDIVGLEDEVNRLLGFSLAAVPYFQEKGFAPAVDIYEEGNNIVADIDLPGIDPKDVDVKVEKDILTIKGKKEEKKEEKKKGYVRIERYSGEFFRQVRLPSGVDSSGAKAAYKNGVLKVTLPKKEEEQSKEIKIDIE